MSEWLDENSDSASADDLQKMVDDLKNLTHDLQDRVKEHKLRPESVQALRNMMNISQTFLSNMKNMSDQGLEMFTGVEITTLETLLFETSVWLDDAVERQANTSKTVTPVLTLKQIAEKSNALNREVKYLVNKMRYAPPPKSTTTPAPKKKDKKRKSKKSNQSAEQSEADLEAIVEALEDATQEDGPQDEEQPELLPVEDQSEQEKKSTEESVSQEEEPKPSPVQQNSSDDVHTEL